MAQFIRAVGGMKNSVIYTDIDERHFRFLEEHGHGAIIIQEMFGLEKLVKNIIKSAKRMVLLFSQMMNLGINHYWIH